MGDQKSVRTKRVWTQDLQPGDHIVGTERMEIIVPLQGYYVDRTEYDKQDGSTIVYFKTSPNYPEPFNPYYTWYVEIKETDNGTTEEGSLRESK